MLAPIPLLSRVPVAFTQSRVGQCKMAKMAGMDFWRILHFLENTSFFCEYFIFCMAAISAQIQIHGCTDTPLAKRALPF